MYLTENSTPHEVACVVTKIFNNVAFISKGESRLRTLGSFPINLEKFSKKDVNATEILLVAFIAVQ